MHHCHVPLPCAILTYNRVYRNYCDDKGDSYVQRAYKNSKNRK